LLDFFYWKALTVHLCVVGLFFLAPLLCWGNTSNADHVSRVEWATGRSGDSTVLLLIPAEYGHWNQGAVAADKAINPEGHEQPNGQVHQELLIAALWPGLTGDNSKDHGEFDVPGGGRRMIALIHSGAIEEFNGHYYNALRSAYDSAIYRSTKMLCVAPFEQPNKAQDAKAKCYPRDSADIKPPKFGLNRVGVDFSKYPDIPETARHDLMENDIFFSYNKKGELDSVITCMAEEAKTVDDGPEYAFVAQCTHNFVSRRLNAFVSISYRRIYLNSWRAIQSSWDRLLTSFIVDPASDK